MNRSHWAQLGESTFVTGIWFLYGVHRLFGRLPFRLLLYPVVAWQWLRRGHARRASRQYLERLQQMHPVFARAPGWRQSLRHFLVFGETLLDKMLAVGGHFPRGGIDFRGHETVLAALQAGQGGVFVTAHMGCLELLQGAAAWRQGLRLTVLVHTAHAERFNRVLARLDPAAQVRLLQVGDFSPAMAMMLADRVAAGEYLAIAGDRVPVRGERVVRVPFLGHEAPFPAGPWLMASLLRCPVYLLACVHHRDGYRVTVERMATQLKLPHGSREQALGACAAQFAAWIEARLRESPYDWFNFFPFWDQALHVHATE